MRYFNGLLLYPLIEKLSKRRITEKLEELRSFDELSQKQKNARQTELLIQTVNYARSNIPYYKDLFQKKPFDSDLLKRDLNYFQEIPVLTKEIVREEGVRLRTPSAHHARKTGGSTGQSAWFFYDDEGLDWTAAINKRAYEYCNKKNYHIDCHISAELGISPVLMKHKIHQFLKLTALNRRVLFIDSFAEKDIKHVYKRLKSFRPYLLQGHPSTLYAIAAYIEKNNIKVKSLCGVFEPSGEMLTEKIVSKIEQFISCKVVNRYGNAEFGVVAHSTPPHNFRKLKVFQRAFYVETCEASNLIITNLTNKGMPLLRYDTGDIGTVQEEDDGLFISDILGRSHDCVNIAGSDFPTHYIMDFLDHKVGKVRQFQIFLRDNANPLLKIVAEDHHDTQRIQQLILSRWPRGLDLAFTKFENLETSGWRNKFKYVIDERAKNV